MGNSFASMFLVLMVSLTSCTCPPLYLSLSVSCKPPRQTIPSLFSVQSDSSSSITVVYRRTVRGQYPSFCKLKMIHCMNYRVEDYSRSSTRLAEKVSSIRMPARYRARVSHNNRRANPLTIWCPQCLVPEPCKLAP